MQFLSKHYKQIRSGVVPTLHKDIKTLSEHGADILKVQKKKIMKEIHIREES